MFGKMLKRKDTQFFSKNLYSSALGMTRRPDFYTKGGVPDTFDGRFELLLLHVFLILNKLMKREDYDETSQDLFDQVFKDMDQVLRERGIGDMGIPKHMRRMMLAFNGRMHAYQLAISPESLKNIDIGEIQATDLKETLKRNLFGTCEQINESSLDYMEQYVLSNIDSIGIDDQGIVSYRDEVLSGV